MNQGLRTAAVAATGVLVAAVPLWFTPWTVELRPQKVLVVATALAVGAPFLSWPAIVGLIGVVALTAWRPDGLWEAVVVLGAPAAIDVLRAGVAVLGRPGAARWVRNTGLALGGIAWLQLAGVPLYPSYAGAFDLPYALVAGPLGNPGHLATWCTLALAVGLWPVIDGERADEGFGATRLQLALAAGVTASAVVLSRAHLGWIGLAVIGVGLALALLPRRAGPIVAGVATTLAGVGLVLGAHAARGRLWLAEVVLTGWWADGATGPGRFPAAFLRWQAERLAAHPDEVGRWSAIVHPHDDAVALLVVAGLPVAALVAAGAFLVLWRWRRPSHGARLWGATVAVLAVGGTVAYQPSAWALALLGVAFLAPKPGHPRGPRVAAAAIAVVGVLALAATHVAGQFCQQRATTALASGDTAAAIAWSDTAAALPFDAGAIALLRGRALLEAGRADEAAAVLAAAGRVLPHPALFEAEAEALEAAGQDAHAARASALRARGVPIEAETPGSR